jgi:hypothetical protein
MSGIKISTSGDVFQSSPNQLAVSSDYPNLMILDSQQPPHFGNTEYTFTTNPAAGTQFNILTIPHGFGFIPANVMDWSDINGAHYGTGRLDLDVTGFASIRGYANADNFLIDFIRLSTDMLHIDLTGQTWKLRYYIFCRPAT